MAFIDRLKDARKNAGLTQEKLAQKIGVAKSTYTGYEKGNSEPNMYVLSKIMDALKVDANYLYQDEVEEIHDTRATPYEMEHLVKRYRLLDPYGKEAVDGVLDVEYRRCDAERKADRREKKDTAAIEEPEEEAVYILPYYLHPSSAGTGEHSEGDEWEELTLRKRPPRGASYVVRVRGDSMEPTYRDGDRVFVRVGAALRPGQIGIFIMGGEQYIKELGDGVLISHNPEYGFRPMTADVRCQGLVLGVCDESYFE